MTIYPVWSDMTSILTTLRIPFGNIPVMTWTSVSPDSPASESQPYFPLSTAVACSTTREETKSGYDEEEEEEDVLLPLVVGGAGFGRRLRTI